MSYVVQKRRGRKLKRGRPRQGMGDMTTFMYGAMCNNVSPGDALFSTCQSIVYGDDADYTACSAAADQATSSLDAQTQDLATNWQPTGTYATADVRSIVSTVMTMVQQAQSAVTQALTTAPSTQQDLLNQMQDNLFNDGQQATNYTQAANDADSQSVSVNAPNLKQWVTGTMTDCSMAMHAAAVVSCQLPWYVSALASFQAAFNAVYALAQTIVGVAVALATDAVDAVETGLNLTQKGLGILDWMINNPLLTLGGIALVWYLIGEEHRQKVRDVAKTVKGHAQSAVKMVAAGE